MKRLLWFSSLFVLAALVATALAYPHLPDPMPIHFDLRGNVDGYAPLPWAPLFMPLTMLGLAIVLVLSHRRVETERGAAAVRVLDLVGLVTLGFLLELHVVVLRFAMGASLDVARIVMGSVGLFCAIIGNAFGKLTRNRVVGIRVPPTLADDETWLMTHRFAGKLMVMGGLVVATAAACGAATGMLVVVLLFMTALPIVYAYLFQGGRR